ncbi:tellurite resistance TerB family protein [Streptomyces triticirhizae]|uniref:Tellurium resistance protein n=1 Tax=Streptomyces triticirhizae TaxID=2483353 RepID=A0A3M2L1M6_9ACTN|nr:tellurite resistance TerB family protein [Streptomyces triticirhizae]RMI31557.1 tellurium resistance protein [Streptomyces triticirhizae]
MAMWDRIKDQAKGLQQSRSGSGHGSGHAPSGGRGESKAKLVSALKAQLTSLKGELKSGGFRDASVALCALVAAADGHVDPAERQQVEQLILTNDVLQNFPADQLRRQFAKHVDALGARFSDGRSAAMAEVAKVAKKPQEARAVVRIGIVVAGADGYVAPAEAAVLREACAALNLSPTEFGI